MNAVQLVARIATSPTLEQHGDTTVATLRIAVQRPKRNGTDQGADFFDVTAVGAQAETAVRYLDVGRRVAISGRLRQQTWQQASASLPRAVRPSVCARSRSAAAVAITSSSGASAPLVCWREDMTLLSIEGPRRSWPPIRTDLAAPPTLTRSIYPNLVTRA